jgi:hypothetical protein
MRARIAATRKRVLRSEDLVFGSAVCLSDTARQLVAAGRHDDAVGEQLRRRLAAAAGLS